MRTAYLGHSVIGLHSRAKYEKLTPEPVTVENTHEAIVDQATWDRVQAMPKMCPRANGRNGSEGAPLSGLLICGRCHSPMHAATSRTSKTYLCSRYHAGHGCGHCHVHRDSMLRAVAAKLREHVLMGSQSKLEQAIQKELDRRRAPVVDDSATRRKLAKLDGQIERAARRMLACDDAVVGDVEKQLVGLRRERDSLAATVGKVPTKPLPSAREIAAKVWELDRILTEASPTQVRLALRQIVASIVLNFEPAGETGRGKRYRFVGGTIQLSQEVTHSAECGG